MAFSFSLVMPLAEKRENPLLLEEGWEGSWILTLTFWNVKTSLRGPVEPPLNVSGFYNQDTSSWSGLGPF